MGRDVRPAKDYEKISDSENGEHYMTDIDKSSPSILVVDDEESLRLTFQIFLEREGYGPVVTAATFDEAMALIERQNFDLIISDIVMEGASGIDLLHNYRSKPNE